MGPSTVQEAPAEEIRRLGSVKPFRDKWRARVWWRGELKHIAITRTEDEGWDRIALYLHTATTDGSPTGPVTLDEFAKKWWERRELEEGVAHVSSERSSWKRHVTGTALGDTPIEDITPLDVHEWSRQTLRKPVVKVIPVRQPGGGYSYKCEPIPGRTIKVKTVANAFYLVKRCLDDAVIRRHCQFNVARQGIRLPEREDVEDAWTFLTHEEINQLITCEAIPLQWRTVYTVAIFTGMRRGELVALQWGDVDFQSRQITVRRSLKRGKPKSGRVRHIPLFDAALEPLKRWRRTVGPIGGLVFPKRAGGMRREDDDFYWAAYSDRHGKRVPGYKEVAGIVRPVRFHDMRHTCASHLVMGTWGQEWSLLEVCTFMGHRDTKTTKRYAHLCPEGLKRLASQTAQSEKPIPSHPAGSGTRKSRNTFHFDL
jgi:integrase